MDTAAKRRKDKTISVKEANFNMLVSSILDDLSLSVNEKQKKLCEVYYKEALRYRENAKKNLEKAKVDNFGYYQDIKYVRAACGIAYSGLLLALECYLTLKEVKVIENKRKSIDFYRNNMHNKNKKLCNNLNNAYDILHRWGYYDGIVDSGIVKSGFRELDIFIELINPSKFK